MPNTVEKGDSLSETLPQSPAPVETAPAPIAYEPAKDGGTIRARIVAVMREAEPIRKARENTQQHYKFRGIDDVYAALQQILAKHGVFTRSEIVRIDYEERKTSKGANLIYRVLHMRFHFEAVDGSSIATEVIGEGMDSGDKAANKAMSVAHKYAFLQALAIPTEDAKDPENDSPDPAPRGGGNQNRNQNEPRGGGRLAQDAPPPGEPAHKYGGSDQDRRDLADQLKKWNIPQDLWKSVAAKMKEGREMSYRVLRATINEAIKERDSNAKKESGSSGAGVNPPQAEGKPHA